MEDGRHEKSYGQRDEERRQRERSRLNVICGSDHDWAHEDENFRLSEAPVTQRDWFRGVEPRKQYAHKPD